MTWSEVQIYDTKVYSSRCLGVQPRSWGFSEKSKRRTLQRDDIQSAIAHTETFDFLQDVIQ